MSKQIVLIQIIQSDIPFLTITPCSVIVTFVTVVISIYPCVCMHVCLYLSPQAKVDNEILDYRDLAAIPKVKAIYDIERPDLITYEPLYTTSLDEREERRESVGEVNTQTACIFSCMHAIFAHTLLCIKRNTPQRKFSTSMIFIPHEKGFFTGGMRYFML